MIGIIGGSGFYSLLNDSEEIRKETPYGEAVLYRGMINSTEVFFIPRHGKEHTIPPHMVNYRANIWALKDVGVKKLFATYACGIISEFTVGDLILSSDLIAFHLCITFFDDFKEGLKHKDFTNIFENSFKRKVMAISKDIGINVKDGGIVATTFGPRFETKSEINALKILGANLVSMTHAYESILAHELDMEHVALCIGTNYAAGISEKLSHEEVLEVMNLTIPKIKRIIENII